MGNIGRTTIKGLKRGDVAREADGGRAPEEISTGESGLPPQIERSPYGNHHRSHPALNGAHDALGVTVLLMSIWGAQLPANPVPLEVGGEGFRKEFTHVVHAETPHTPPGLAFPLGMSDAKCVQA